MPHRAFARHPLPFALAPVAGLLAYALAGGDPAALVGSLVSWAWFGLVLAPFVLVALAGLASACGRLLRP